VQALAALLQRAGFAATVSPQIQKDIWFKLWGNMTVNPISAFTGATTDRILNDDLVRGFVSAVMLEAKDIGARIGIPIDQQPEDRHAVTRKLGAFKTSMLQDVEAGKPVELDALVGGARAGPEDRRAHPLHRRAAGPGAGARAGAWAVLMTPPTRKLSGTAFATLLLIALMMGANHVAARLAFNHGVDVATAVTFRSAVTALVLAGLLLAQRRAAGVHGAPPACAAGHRPADRRAEPVPVFGRGAAAGGAGPAGLQHLPAVDGAVGAPVLRPPARARGAASPCR
jgi:hypothetical protein